MKMVNVMTRVGSDFDSRKNQILRKEMDQAYKKQSKYGDPSKNPLLIVLENLLSGKAEQELLEQDVLNKDVSEQEPHIVRQAYSSDLLQTTNVVKDEQTNTDSLQGTIDTLKELHETVLQSTSKSEQDVRVAEIAASQVQTVTGEELEAIDFDSDIEVDIPERFTKDVERDVHAETVFGKDLEKLLVNRAYSKAKTIYSAHIEMVKNSYRSNSEPIFSIII